MDEAGVKFWKLEKWAKDSGKAMDTAASQASKMWDNVKKAWDESAKSGTKINSVFTWTVWVLKKTWEQLWSMVKWWTALWVTFGGIFAWKVISDMNNFSSKFWLLNATLRAQSDEAQKTVKNSLFEISNRTWKTVEEITDSMTQLFSSWLAPTASEFNTDGTVNQDYINQIKEVAAIQERLALSAMATWETTLAMGNAYVYAAKAMWKDVSSTKDMNEIMDLFAGTLDQWIWVMAEYSNQFVKFGNDSRLAWFKPKETLGIFAEMTKAMNPEMAGHTTSALMRYFNNAPQEIIQWQQNIKRALKAWWFSKSEEEYLGKFLTTEWWDSIFYNVQPDWARVKKSAMEVLDWIAWAMKNLPANSKVSDIMLKSFWWDVATKKALLNLWENFDFTKLKETIDKVGKWDMSSKIAIMEWSFSTRRAKANQLIRNKIIQWADSIAPAMWVFMDMLTWWIDKDTAKTAFDKARKDAEWLSPILIKIVDALEKAYNYLSSDDGQNMMKSIATWAERVWQLLWSILSTVASILADSRVQSLLQFMAEHPVIWISWVLFAWNALSALTGSLVSTLTSAIGTWIARAWIGYAVWASITWVIWVWAFWAGIAYIAWEAIGSIIDKQVSKLDEATKQASDIFNKKDPNLVWDKSLKTWFNRSRNKELYELTQQLNPTLWDKEIKAKMNEYVSMSANERLNTFWLEKAKKITSLVNQGLLRNQQENANDWNYQRVYAPAVAKSQADMSYLNWIGASSPATHNYWSDVSKAIAQTSTAQQQQSQLTWQMIQILQQIYWANIWVQQAIKWIDLKVNIPWPFAPQPSLATWPWGWFQIPSWPITKL